MSTEENKALARRYIEELFNQKNLATWVCCNSLVLFLRQRKPVSYPSQPFHLRSEELGSVLLPSSSWFRPAIWLEEPSFSRQMEEGELKIYTFKLETIHSGDDRRRFLEQ